MATCSSSVGMEAPVPQTSKDVGFRDRVVSEAQVQPPGALPVETAAPENTGLYLFESRNNKTSNNKPGIAVQPDDDDDDSGDDNDNHNNNNNLNHFTATTGGAKPFQRLQSFNSLHTDHRLNHFPSKLPSFRSADRDSLAGLGLLHNKQPPSLPVSPPTGPAGVDSTSLSVDTAHHSSQNTTAIPENSTPPPSASAPLPPALPAPPTPPTPLSPVTEIDDAAHPAASVDSPHSITPPSERNPRSRASTYETASTSAPITPTIAKRSPSLPIDGPASIPPTVDLSPAAGPSSQIDPDSPSFWTPATRPRTCRAASSRASTTSANSSPTARDPRDAYSPGTATEEWATNQRELILPTAVNGALSDEIRTTPRRQSTSLRPPRSYRSTGASSTPGRPVISVISPIPSSRSSGSPKSVQLDMNDSSSRSYDDGDDYQDYHDTSARDRSLRALEGRTSNDWSRDLSPPDADDEVAESENNTADIFMRIAREDSSSIPRRRTDGRGGGGDDDDDDRNSVVTRVARNPRQRPLSTIYTTSSSQNTSTPPSASRRLSDQLTSRIRRAAEEIPNSYSTRDTTIQAGAAGKPSLKVDPTRARSTVSALKPSPITPRTQSVLDNQDKSSIFARRPSTNDHSRSRSTSLRHPTSLSKSFNSSPLVPKNVDTPPQNIITGLHEASESSNSTAAPSTVWDELDELKSRIHRLELTGKMPKTSGAAMSRASEERPPTAGTGATTISGSPKRASGVGVAPTEIISTVSSQRDQPILKSALRKTKPFVSSDVYDAIEAASNDALSLAQIMGTTGQAGPISSGASTIGAGGPSTVTDRQLRKKTESLCRSLTELCLALTEEGNQRKNTSSSRPQTRGTSRSRDHEPPNSPPTMRIFTGANQQRQIAQADEPLPSIEDAASPRAIRLDKRATFNFTGMSGVSNAPSPRYAPSVIGGEESGRKSSLIVARSRRGVTDEPDDQGRRTALLRTRRAGTDELPDDSRKSSLVLPPRRVTTIGRVSNIDEETQVASRVPSRATTEVTGGLRIAVPARSELMRGSQAQEPASATAIQPRRRLITTNLPTPGPYSSRLATPTTPGGRRFLQVGRGQEDRGDTGNITERLADERGPQRYSMSSATPSVAGRTTNLHRKRNSGIPSFSGTASNVGGYR